MKKRLLTTLLIVALIVSIISCSVSDNDKPLKISATTWIGYTPLFYAKEKGWLSKINVKLIHVVSLSENMYLYKAGNSDAYVGTQYEYSVLKDEMNDLIPIMTFDRSNGGDIVMSNVSIQSLQKGSGEIDAYLEMDSINSTILEDFITRYKIDEKRINYINRDQTEIAALKKEDLKGPTLAVTYIPYDTDLKKSGFKEILSTKDNLDLLVVDAMFTKVGTLVEHKQKFLKVKKFVGDALTVLHKDPRAFYEVIKPYMDGQTYEDFSNGLGDIEWIHHGLSLELQERMRHSLFPIKDLI
jgi:NitT/TauT family transport system substrate-binding protein